MREPISEFSHFIFLEDQPSNADIILVPGGSYPELMIKACELYLQGFAPLILPSGGCNKRLPDFKTEWDYFLSIAKGKGVPEQVILKEDKAEHTFDNARLSWSIIQNNNIKIDKAILVCKSFHARRALLTYQTEFRKDIEFIIVPIVDERNITKNNWYLDDDKITKVFDEIEKIGKYFGKHINKWVSE